MAEKNNRFSGMTRAELEKEARKQIVHSGLLALAALIVIAVACYAWFCSAGAVTAQGMAVRLSGYGFDLASAGDLPDLEVGMPEDYTDPTGEAYGSQDIPKVKWKWTAGRHQVIQWQMTDESNFYNMSGSAESEGLRPGASGKLQFYVIPREPGSLKIAFTLEVNPYDYDAKRDRMVKMDMGDDTARKARDLLHGHLLFAFSYNGTETLVNLIQAEPCTLDFGEIGAEQVDVPIPVTVNWFWPLTWEKAAQNASILALAQANPDCFFETVPEAGLNADLQTLNEQYNSADEYIGKYVFAVSLKMIGKRA